MSQSESASATPAMPAPVPALPYSVPAHSGRPGLIVTIAILCIVIGCLSGLANLIMGTQAIGFYVVSKISTTRSSSVAATLAMPASASMSLPPADTAVATNELTRQLSLSGAHVRELNKLLRLHGREIFGVDEDTSLTAAAVRAAITDAAPPGADRAPAHFATPAGRVDVYADRALFTSSDGASTAETSAAHGTEATSQPIIATQTSPAGATPSQINQALAAIQKNFGVKLNPNQTAAIRSALAAPNQQLITPGNGTPVVWATQQPNGNVTVQFDSGTMSLGPQGQVLVQTSNALGVGPTISGRTFALLATDVAGSLALAIYVFVLGILLFRVSARMPRLLRWYAWLKIPLACLAGVAWPLMVYELASNTGGPAGARGLYILWGAVIAVLGSAFPIGLILALRTRTAREYFSPVVTGPVDPGHMASQSGAG